MKLYTSSSLNKFLEHHESTRQSIVKIACPFITNSGIERFIVRYKKRATRIQILTNLSPINQALSLTNPIVPLDNINIHLKDRVTIKNNHSLHAKLYLFDKKSALLGSSNLTTGGMLQNKELNIALFSNKKSDSEQIINLVKWFDSLWNISGDAIDEQRFAVLSARWEKTNKPLRAIINSLIPNPRLGSQGDYWKTVQKLLRRKKWKIHEAKSRLSLEGIESRLNFLAYLGLIDFDKKNITVINKDVSNKIMYELIKDYFTVPLESILSFVRDNPGCKYKDLFKSLDLLPNNGDIPILWVESLGYIRSTQKETRYKKFFLTPSGRKLI